MFTKKHILYTPQPKEPLSFEEPSLIANIQNDEYQGYTPLYIPKKDDTPKKDDIKTNITTSPETIQTPIKPTPEKSYKSLFNSKSEFISQMTPIYERVLTSKNIDKSFAKALVQQSGLESNWGKSQSGKFNLGGIKGKGTVRRTREVIDGKDTYINDSFRDFNSLDDYALYHIDLLNNKRYQAFAGDISEFASRVTKGGYATDPTYQKKLEQLIFKGKHGFSFKDIYDNITNPKQKLDLEATKQQLVNFEGIKDIKYDDPNPKSEHQLIGAGVQVRHLSGDIKKKVDNNIKLNNAEINEINDISFNKEIKFLKDFAARNNFNFDDLEPRYQSALIHLKYKGALGKKTMQSISKSLKTRKDHPNVTTPDYIAGDWYRNQTKYKDRNINSTRYKYIDGLILGTIDPNQKIDKDSKEFKIKLKNESN